MSLDPREPNDLISYQLRQLLDGQVLLQQDVKDLQIEVAGFRPVKRIVFWAVSIILTSVLGALVSLVLIKK